MRKIMKNVFFTFFCLNILASSLQASFFEDGRKKQMIQDLEIIKHHFEIGYAPAEWKKEYLGWDLNEAFEKSKNQILEAPSIDTKQFQQILRNFINSMRDYHVSVMFFSTEAASLPFSVKRVENRYFIDWVDPLRLPSDFYNIYPGDELIKFDGRRILDVMAELEQVDSKFSNEQTDQALATMKLTTRTGMTGDFVPKGPIIISTKSAKTKKILTHQLHWSYTPECVKNPLDFIPALDFILGLIPKTYQLKPKIESSKVMMANPLHEAYALKHMDRPGTIGSRKSFLPQLGELIWSNDKTQKDKEKTKEESKSKDGDKGKDKQKTKKDSFWHAYIYQQPQGQTVGYIRIPHYMIFDIDAELEDFGKLIETMEEKTDVLVIDQLHNFGGFVHIQYILASMLTQKPLQSSYHRIKLTQEEVFYAYHMLEEIKFIEKAIDYLKVKDEDLDDENQDDSDQTKNKKESLSLFNYQELLFLKSYCELIVEEWNKGQKLSSPTPILGVDKINPHPKYRYTKPILMLINEMDFSGGDFMPALLQDNQRALLFGTRTAGAGGYVSSFHFPNNHGIASCSYTASIAERMNSEKIENLGVTPDIQYDITLEDMQQCYSGYVEAVNQAVQALLEQAAN